MQKPKILVVEGDEIHLQKAVCVLEEAGLEVIVARSALEGIRKIQAGGIDGIITGVFMAHDGGGPRDAAKYPCGIEVTLAAQKFNVPFIVCIAGDCHGPRYEWIWSLGFRLQWPEMVDRKNSENPNHEAKEKNWGYALSRLKGLLQ